MSRYGQHLAGEISRRGYCLAGTYLITRGGSNNATYFLNVYIYDSAFIGGNDGYASALTWILLAIIGMLTAMVFSSSKYWVYYND